MIGVTERTEGPAEEAGGHMSGLFDIDGNGIVDPGEEYLAFRIWEEMTFYRNMAAKYGVQLYLSECTDIPGEIIYEDNFQIAVKNPRNDIPIQTHQI